MKYEAPTGLKKLNNADFDHRLGGAPTPDVSKTPYQAPKIVTKRMSKEEVIFNTGDHKPRK